MFLHRLGKVKAPEFPKGLKWLNGNARTMKQLLGKVVLVDFWTYSCINCQHTLPHLVDWHKKYAKYGLVIVGVHTPEFAFEKDEENVKKAIKDSNVSYLVVLDNDYKIWNAYTNRWWPRKFLIDSHGDIVYDHIGEGGYAETESAIQKALTEIGAKNLPPIEPDVSVGGGICYRTTPETYLGFMRGRFANAEGFIPNAEQVYSDASEHQEDIVYLHGHWKIASEFVEHTKKLPSANEYLALKYSSFSVNLVMGLSAKKTGVIEIELDGRPLPEDMAGRDVKIGIDGKAMVNIKEHRMYRLIEADTYHRGTLKIKTAADNVRFYAFTFGGCKDM
ncbi:MAG: thioredoxin-like domain-containing protein [Patescibacteria group bacterium]|nr:redoxin domain-containing protein [Patescibacteria group bacterium]